MHPYGASWILPSAFAPISRIWVHLRSTARCLWHNGRIFRGGGFKSLILQHCRPRRADLCVVANCVLNLLDRRHEPVAWFLLPVVIINRALCVGWLPARWPSIPEIGVMAPVHTRKSNWRKLECPRKTSSSF